VIKIKAINTIQEIDRIAAVEAKTWGMNPGDTVPEHLLLAIAREGGVLLGAYDGARLVGYTMGWLGLVDPDSSLPAARQLKLISHMTVVIEEYRDQRIGYQLKLAQREWAIDQGLDLITWTYDPLESRNGYFNIHLLGCVCDTYLGNYYGEMNDQMNQGIPSDRFRVDWWITDSDLASTDIPKSDSVGTPGIDDELPKERQIAAHDPKYTSTGLISPPERSEILDAPRIFVEIPSDFQEIRLADLDLALSWRIHTRSVFEAYFLKEYQVVDFIFQRSPAPRSWYVLDKKS
jgi:predicted GNAT superfamily acetyltransferase